MATACRSPRLQRTRFLAGTACAVSARQSWPLRLLRSPSRALYRTGLLFVNGLACQSGRLASSSWRSSSVCVELLCVYRIVFCTRRQSIAPSTYIILLLCRRSVICGVIDLIVWGAWMSAMNDDANLSPNPPSSENYSKFSLAARYGACTSIMSDIRSNMSELN